MTLPARASAISPRRPAEPAWRAHVRNEDGPTVVSLFAGGGGSSTGYELAGYRVAAAVEFDAKLGAPCYRRNHPATPLLERDVTELSGSEILEAAGLERGELDVLDGSPPCQTFSRAAARANREAKLNDPRTQLPQHYARLLGELRPRAFVGENVSTMASGPNWGVFKRWAKDCEEHGYKVRATIVNFCLLGVPQARERLVLVGVRDDLGIDPPAIEPETKPTACGPVLHRLSGLGHQPPPIAPGYHRWWPSMKPGQRVSDVTADRKNGFSFYRIDPRKPAPTLIVVPQLFHPWEPRHLNSVELAAIGGFPEGYEFASWREAQKVVGNSVPPEGMRRIALRLRRAIMRAS